MTDPSPTQVEIDALVAELEAQSQLAVCPYDQRSPDYWTAPNDKPCPMCGGEPEGPDKCTGADLRSMKKAASVIRSLQGELAAMKKERDEHLRLKNELVRAAYPAMDAAAAIREWCDNQQYENDLITVAQLRRMLPEARASQAEALSTDQPRGARVTDAIYIASKVKHADRWRKVAAAHPVSSSWIYEAGEGETSDFDDLWRRCLTEASGSKAIVIYREPGEVLKGAWVELGAALSAGVPVHAVGIEEFTVAKFSRITHHATFEAALEASLQEAPAPATEQRETVPRFDSAAIMYSLDGVEPKPSPNGYWVRYSDHVAALEAASVSEAKPVAWRYRLHKTDGWTMTERELSPKELGPNGFQEPLYLHPRKD